MFGIFRRKKKIEEDPILKELNRQTEELKELSSMMKEHRRNLDKAISDTENKLRDLGYTENDLEKIKTKSRFKAL